MKLNTHDTILNFIGRMVNDGYSESRISRIKGRMNKLLKYLSDNNLNEINEDIVVSYIFYRDNRLINIFKIIYK